MKLINYKQVNSYDIEKWLKKELQLTPYQQDLMRNNEVVRFSGFKFIEYNNVKDTNIIWRLSIILIPIVFVLLIISMGIKYLLTGNAYYKPELIEKYYYGWLRKTNLFR